MKRTKYGCRIASVLVGCVGAASAVVLDLDPRNVPNVDPIMRFDDIPAAALMPTNGSFGVAPDGTFAVGGKPRYLVGTLYYEGNDYDVGVANQGYADAVKWFYDDIPDYAGHQRLGFDTVGTFVPLTWQNKYRPEETAKNPARFQPDMRYYGKWIHAGLPLYVDYTAAPWSHGHFPVKEGLPPPASAFFRGGSFFPFRLTVPEGRQLWLDLWTGGAQFLKDQGAKPMVYELFNEPGYLEDSPEARALFVARMREKYGDIAKLNAAWHADYADFDAVGKFERPQEQPSLNIEWMCFFQDLFDGICAEGIAAIKAVDPRPEAGFTFQPLFMDNRGLNFYKTSRRMNFVTSSTGGGDLVQGHFLRAIADGKPIMDGEMYAGGSRAGFRNPYVRQFIRGFNASYIFKWCKRSLDWRNRYLSEKDADGKDKRDAKGRVVWEYERNADGSVKLDTEGNPVRMLDYSNIVAKARSCAESFGYCVLNPWAARTEWIRGIQDAKLDILDVSELFGPRDRGVPREVAVLYSYPSRHVGWAVGIPGSVYMEQVARVLDYSHVPEDIILEEQLAEGRQRRYKVIVAAGVDAVYDETPERLRKWVEDGGVLMLYNSAMDRNALSWPRSGNDFPGIVLPEEAIPCAEPVSFDYAGTTCRAMPFKDLPAAPAAPWKPAAVAGERTLVYERDLGKGRVVFVNARFQSEDLRVFLEAFLKREKGIEPDCRMVDAVTGADVFSVETTKAARNGLVGYAFRYEGNGARLVKFIPPERDLAFCEIFHGDDESPRTLLGAKDGAYVLRLIPGQHVLLVGGSLSDLERRYGKMPVKSHETLMASGMEWLEASRPKATDKKKAYVVDPDRVEPVDLRTYATTGFEDRVAGDGKGGWTDEGADNSLSGAPWGIVDCNGVPMEFIRVDQNGGRTCIVMGSKRFTHGPMAIDGIAVNRKASALYFLHASAWSGGEPVHYVVHYGDGSETEIPIKDWLNCGDWWYPRKRLKMESDQGWVNTSGKGFYIWRWENPHPDKTIVSLDLKSNNGNSIYVLAAISVEKPE